MGRRLVRQLRNRGRRDPVEVAIGPVLAGLEGFDDGVARLMKVGGRVPIRRVVAAAYVTAVHAEPKVHPLRAGFETLLAAWPARLHGGSFRGRHLLAMLAFRPRDASSRARDIPAARRGFHLPTEGAIPPRGLRGPRPPGGFSP